MQGQSLHETLIDDTPVRNAALFGTYGSHVNLTNGRYVYMRAPVDDNQPLYEYTLMPTHIRWLFTPEELQTAELAGPFSFTKDCRVLRMNGHPWGNPRGYGTLLFDLVADPGQMTPIDDVEVEAMMIEHLLQLMHDTDAPAEQYQRLGLAEHVNMTQVKRSS
jgi:hypothetical protein